MNIELFTSAFLKQQQTIIEYGFYSTSYGILLLAILNNKICHCAFVLEENKESAIETVRKRWPEFVIHHNNAFLNTFGTKIFSDEKNLINDSDITILLRGTPFQCAVWRAVAQIPVGTTVSYQTIAEFIKHPRASRAVGTALAHNQLALLIPCHRVIQKNGSRGNYRWGIELKERLWNTENRIITNKPTFNNTIFRSR